ncbi:MAG TPA: agmatine deiminase family protein, partial [Pirellulales bacterium]
MMCRWWRLGLSLCLVFCGELAPTGATAASPHLEAAPKSRRDRARSNDLAWIDGDRTGDRPTPPGFSKEGAPANATPKISGALARDRQFDAPSAQGTATAGPEAPRMTLPGEFERQAAIVLGCGQLATFAPETLAEVVASLQGQAPVIALAPDAKCRQEVLRALHKRRLSPDAVQFVAVRHDTMWARDYGPLLVRQADGSPALVDANYAEFQRHQDDAVPRVLAGRFEIPAFEAPLSIEGGNLLSNGRGLCLTTQKTLTHNVENGATEADVRAALREYYGAEQAVFLEPLHGEGTGHVDMFACFVAADTVVVGKYDPQFDPKNAAVLDRNAETLAGLKTAAGALKVERVPMPSNEDGVWRSYTNIVFANGVVLMPTYDRDEAGRAEALAVYRRLLPERKVTPIDASSIITMGGALHCLSLNLTAVESPKPLAGPSEASAARTA